MQTGVKKAGRILVRILAYLNRCLYATALILVVTFLCLIPKCKEDYVTPDGETIEVEIRLDHRTVNNMIAFTAIPPLILFSLLERRSKKLRHWFCAITFVAFLVFLVFRVFIECPQEF